MQNSGRPSSNTPPEPDPSRLVDDMFDVLVRLLRGVSGALFALSGDAEPKLLASRNVDQRLLDTAHRAWARAPEAMRHGSPRYQASDDGRLILLLPCLQAGKVTGLACVQLSALSDHLPASDITTFATTFGRLLARLERSAAAPIEPLAGTGGSQDEIDAADRANLILMLERQEWNVSRAARLMGVTRMTVYNRMRRLEIPRQRARPAQDGQKP